MASRKTISNWLTNRYLLIIRNEENFAEKSTIHFNYAKLIVLIVSVFIILTTISFFLINTVLAQWFDPRYQELQTRKKLINLSHAVDSLAMEVERKDRFIMNLQKVIRGEPRRDNENRYVGDTSVNPQRGKPENNDEQKTLAPIDSQFRRNFEREGVELLSVDQGMGTSNVEGQYLFKPISGIISSPYDAQNEHYGVDIVAEKDEPVKSIANGTVLFSAWTQDSGYIIAIQHRNNLISVYEHNSNLLKKEGEIVNAGDVIAVIGDTGELSTGPHLHFEIWYNGNPVNPEEFVSF